MFQSGVRDTQQAVSLLWPQHRTFYPNAHEYVSSLWNRNQNRSFGPSAPPVGPWTGFRVPSSLFLAGPGGCGCPSGEGTGCDVSGCWGQAAVQEATAVPCELNVALKLSLRALRSPRKPVPSAPAALCGQHGHRYTSLRVLWFGRASWLALDVSKR